MDAAQIKAELRHAVRFLSDRGLILAAKWAAELCAGLQVQSARVASLELSDSDAEEDLFLLVKTCMDAREYKRAAFLARAAVSPRLMFMRLYSLYLAGEQAKEDRQLELAGPLEKQAVSNPELHSIRHALEQQKPLDGCCQYLYGVVLQQLELPNEARTQLIQSLSLCPLNWSAWLALLGLCRDKQTVETIMTQLKPHWMNKLFHAHVLLDLQYSDEALQLYSELSPVFAKTYYLETQIAQAHYSKQDFEESMSLFETARAADPHNLTHIDTLSNILYVREDKSRLAELAREAQASDKYRPETCCVIANYYSSRGEHEKSIQYFMRALRLNPGYLSAWTLIGHEFLEMKNASAAVQAYRRAVDVSDSEYRAWYGLGQTYELLHLPLYALHYFRKAATIRPNDARMWCAMAGCYEAMSRPQDAIKCFERAVQHSDREGVALNKLARLHKLVGDSKAAARYFKLHLEMATRENLEGDEVSDALLYLAQHAFENGAWQEAESYCLRLLDCPGAQREEARALLQRIQQRGRK
eukprot:TRINITY_DN7533_c0_g1_i1.p1 TRINITY_DN7533_c0_g1~~TRINITY_DN7533_c0_g1_i1.p1  ORF type:complete len:528 (+),score=97.38 TRINITY_DN7533_c0_g1_i1:42-1625(+)